MLSQTRSVLFEIAKNMLLIATQGRSSPFAVSIGWDAYNAFLKAKKRKERLWAIRRLKEQQLLKIRELGEHVTITLTTGGRILVFKEQILRMKQRLPDDIYCMVVFDFPEEGAAGARKMFRNFIKQAGFEQLQKSVWVSRYDVLPLLHELVNLLKCREWVQVFIVKSSFSVLRDKKRKRMT